MSNFLENNNVFCVAPWTHSHITPDGDRQLCCVSEYSFGTNKTIDEIWNCEDIKSIRKKILAGEFVYACNRCLMDKSNPHTYRNFFNRIFSDEIENIITNTKEDGSYDNYPMSLDYRTHTCNFKCKMCYEGCSSQIYAEKLKNGLDIKIINVEDRNLTSDIINNEFNNDEIIKNLKEIYWAGGEPLFSDVHWNTLKLLIDKGYSKNISLRYNSNLSIIDYKNESIIEYFKHFKKVDFSCSLDGTGEIGEWIRTNLDYPKWKRNFERLHALSLTNDNIDIYLAIVVTTPTLFDLYNLYELCYEYNVKPALQSCYSASAVTLMSPKSFPKKLIKPIINEFLAKTENVENEIIDSFRNYIHFLITQNFYETNETYKQDFKFGKDEMFYLEKNRPHQKITFEQILSRNKDIHDFYTNFVFQD